MASRASRTGRKSPSCLKEVHSCLRLISNGGVDVNGALEVAMPRVVGFGKEKRDDEAKVSSKFNDPQH